MIREQSSPSTWDSSLCSSELNSSSHLFYCLSFMVIFQACINLGGDCVLQLCINPELSGNPCLRNHCISQKQDITGF